MENDRSGKLGQFCRDAKSIPGCPNLSEKHISVCDKRTSFKQSGRIERKLPTKSTNTNMAKAYRIVGIGPIEIGESIRELLPLAHALGFR